MRISDWSSDVFSSDLAGRNAGRDQGDAAAARQDRQPDQPSLSAAGRGRSIRRRRDAAIGQGHDRVRRRMNTDSKPLLADLVRAGDQQTEAVVITDFIFMAKAKIGRASCRERVCKYVSLSVVDVSLKRKPYSNKRVCEYKRIVKV